ncbi:MAG: sporulation protein YunB, partial [Sarcina sp.]
ETNLKIVLPLQSREVIVRHQIPISDNIIIGEVPRTSIGIDAIKEAMTDEYDENGIESESIDGQNPLEKAGEIDLPDLPDLGVEFKN